MKYKCLKIARFSSRICKKFVLSRFFFFILAFHPNKKHILQTNSELNSDLLSSVKRMQVALNSNWIFWDTADHNCIYLISFFISPLPKLNCQTKKFLFLTQYFKVIMCAWPVLEYFRTRVFLFFLVLLQPCGSLKSASTIILCVGGAILVT